ncbi:hypothetical protein QT711_01400 [Sporosarcina saromensis]|uniref:Uncharacterized protein n=1 Tax=Sporosarcina saromensis TaxID=359365 RepID=A0ABU4G4E3_9BACL|nr:hypothetical protein [Sporosarcina saromensis]
MKSGRSRLAPTSAGGIETKGAFPFCLQDRSDSTSWRLELDQ